jgi:putative membrane protein
MDWDWDPVILTLLGISLLLYLRGAWIIHQRRGHWQAREGWQHASFLGGILVLFLALISPLHAISESLFSVHMLQHVLIMDVAAPLLVLSFPLLPCLFALPVSARRAIGQWWAAGAGGLQSAWHWISRPAVVWCVAAGIVWLWHMPIFYMAAVRQDWIHALEHGCFLGSACLFWWTVVSTFGRHPERRWAAVLFLITYTLQDTLLGALIILAPQPWYPIYAASAQAFSITPLADQQLAGLVMGIPDGTIYLMAIFLLLRTTSRDRNNVYGSSNIYE